METSLKHMERSVESKSTYKKYLYTILNDSVTLIWYSSTYGMMAQLAWRIFGKYHATPSVMIHDFYMMDLPSGNSLSNQACELPLEILLSSLLRKNFCLENSYWNKEKHLKKRQIENNTFPHFRQDLSLKNRFNGKGAFICSHKHLNLPVWCYTILERCYILKNDPAPIYPIYMTDSYRI
jgi:hypothetical protein